MTPPFFTDSPPGIQLLVLVLLLLSVAPVVHLLLLLMIHTFSVLSLQLKKLR